MIYDRSVVLELFSEYLKCEVNDVQVDAYCDNDKMFYHYGTIHMNPETFHNFVNNQLTPFIKKKIFREQLDSI